jgi:hypothetical protein
MKKNKLPSLISILILTLITSLMWISFNIYRSLMSQPPPVVSGEVSNPLTPTLDKDSINQIEERLFLDDSQIPDNIAVGTATPVATSTPEATPVASPTPASEEATTTPSATPTATP